MTKIMLVEDDKSLREIYGIRLGAEGYEIVSAGDGEEALALAVKEKPDLILSDIMMPKISGFDMLDILRTTPDTKDIKVIMMTALSSEEQRARGESLGANKYLVKSQVGIEDVVKAIKDVLTETLTTSETPPPEIPNQPIVNNQPIQNPNQNPVETSPPRAETPAGTFIPPAPMNDTPTAIIPDNNQSTAELVINQDNPS